MVTTYHLFFPAIATLSGVNDFDYPNILGIQQNQYAGLPSSFLHTVKRVPLPEELFEQFECILSLSQY